MTVFLQRAWRCAVLDLDDETGVYEKPCGRTLVVVVTHSLETVVAHHLHRDHLLPDELLFDDDLGEYDFSGFGAWTYVQSVIRATRSIRG